MSDEKIQDHKRTEAAGPDLTGIPDQGEPGKAVPDSEGRKKGQRRKMHWLSFAAGALVTVAAAAVFLAVYFNLPFTEEPADPASPAAYRKLVTIQNLIDNHYIEDIDRKNETDLMYLGLVAGLNDKYADYYTKEQYEEIRIQNDGEMEGIGVSIAKDTKSGYLRVESVIDGSPADKAGVKKNDRITVLMGKDTSDLESQDAVSLIRNSKDGTVTMTVLHDGQKDPVDLTMEKAVIEQNVVEGKMLEDKIGYIQITAWNRKTAEQFRKVYEDLNDKGMQGLVIDVRDNLGGLVEACCDTLRVFMPKGPLVYEDDRAGGETHRDSKGEDPIEIPVTVLVNGQTASASEMFTGAIQDYGIGKVVGTQTYGKGIEQNSYRLSDGSVVKFTTVHYYTPDHHDINGKGITPDYKVEADEDSGTDLQLDKALEVLKQEM